MAREFPVKKETTALLIIDLQNYCVLPGAGLVGGTKENPSETHKKLVERVYSITVPAVQGLLTAFRQKHREVIYTFIESLTRDGRDQSLDYKLSGFNVPKGSTGAKILEEIAPEEDEIMIPKTACSVFNSTNIEYVLRNLGVTQLVVTGIITNQCVESAVRDAADKGFLCTLVEDACAALSPEEHASALFNLKGFSRICSVDKVVAEVMGWPDPVSP